ncbi:MAG TPA: hypothetical protein VF026_22310 [Ktedonobacteraceae bacterium]
MKEEKTQDSTDSLPGTSLAYKEMLARLYTIDKELAHFIELLLQLEETNPEVAYCLEYLLCISEKQHRTAQVWLREIGNAKRKEARAGSPSQEG